MEVKDAYQEYVKAKREDSQIDHIVTLEMPVSEAASIYRVIREAVDEARPKLDTAAEQRWDAILRGIATAIEEVW